MVGGAINQSICVISLAKIIDLEYFDLSLYLLLVVRFNVLTNFMLLFCSWMLIYINPLYNVK